MPHRLPTSGRYRISNDVLILILENLDPTSLYRTCKVFERIRFLVMQFHHLRYKFELALGGMADGALLPSKRPPALRLQVLLTYRKDWPRLNWTGEQRLKLPAAATLCNVAGDFVFYVAGQTLELMELPSTRLNRPPSQTHHLRFNTNPKPECVAIDHAQSLIVVGHALAGPGGELGMRLKIRNLWNFDKHPRARDNYFDCLAPLSAQPLEKMWFEDQGLYFVKADYLLGAKTYRGRASIHLYNVSNLGNVIIEREYELPRHWAGANMAFAPNVSLTGDTPSPARALFYADANTRITLISAQQPGDANAQRQWLLINESYFRPTSRPDRQFVPWTEWCNYSIMKNVPAFPLIRDVQIVGNRILYLESDALSGGRASENRLGLIEFPAYPDPRNAFERSVLVPTESFKEISSRITQGVGVDSIAATEDNIVLFLEPQHDTKTVHLMTFGVPSSSS
ncbi:hypothetical protein DFP72DRAFT_1151471 [Ephemerocybe angulata]|uniref:F-box domain-containing protein n=1 Tax=Ephemerocybe angulata TaxID=980116 RepID=A0A8H6IA17_9AGAR|nr:hypothetical protein DFP72DRAFT_1151471 [Tulosesus angulatus]